MKPFCERRAACEKPAGKSARPEPAPVGHPFYSLPNCFITPHIAGSMGGEVVRMAEYMLSEYEALSAGEPSRYEVTLKMLETMA